MRNAICDLHFYAELEICAACEKPISSRPRNLNFSQFSCRETRSDKNTPRLKKKKPQEKKKPPTCADKFQIARIACCWKRMETSQTRTERSRVSNSERGKKFLTRDSRGAQRRSAKQPRGARGSRRRTHGASSPRTFMISQGDAMMTPRYKVPIKNGFVGDGGKRGISQLSVSKETYVCTCDVHQGKCRASGGTVRSGGY